MIQIANRLRAACCAGMAMLAVSCGVRETGVQASPPSPEMPRAPGAPATAYHLYVSPKGADGNLGTEAAPFRSIARAAQAALPDTTVHVAPGTYNGGFRTGANGTPKARVYYVSTERWGAKIVPPPNSYSVTAWDNRGNYVDIVGFEIDGTAHQGGVQWLNGIYNAGSYDTIRDNHVHHIATNTCTSEDGAGIALESYYRGIKSNVIGNTIHDIGPADCPSIQGIIVNTSGMVANNVVYRVSEAGIHLWRDAANVIVANNTVAMSNSGIVVGGGDFHYTAGPNDHTHVSNNIVYDNHKGISERGSTGKNNTYTNNLVFQNPGGDWRLSNALPHTQTVAAAPHFVDYNRNGAPDFRLASTSPAIGKGSAAHARSYDIKGEPRNAGTGFDIGAYQH